MLKNSASLIEQLQTAVLIVAEDLSLIDMNGAAENLLGVSSNRLRGQLLGKAWFNISEYQGMFSAAINQQVSISQQDVLVLTAMSRVQTLNCTISPLIDDGNAAENQGFLAVEFVRGDITKTLIHDTYIHDLQRVSETILQGFAHEVKNPLGGLRGAAQLLQRELDDADLREYREYTGVIVDEADRLASLVDRMLAPNDPAEIAPVNLHQVLNRVATLVAAELPDSVQLRADYDPSIPPIMGDSGQLIQGVLNVVRNAMQALTEADIVGEIIIRSRVRRNMTIGALRHRLVAQVDVIDNGPGISADLQAQIFYPLITGRAEGTGLGLPIAQSLISQLCGLVGFTSEPGQTVFSIYLPIAQEQ